MRTRREFHVAGTTFDGRQDHIRYIDRNRGRTYVSLRREAKNAFDGNAVAVIGHVRGGEDVRLGYVPRDIAAEMAPRMDAGRIAWCKSFHVVCGGPRRTYGVIIDVTY